jgi:hypothetical protein
LLFQLGNFLSAGAAMQFTNRGLFLRENNGVLSQFGIPRIKVAHAFRYNGD